MSCTQTTHDYRRTLAISPFPLLFFTPETCITIRQLNTFTARHKTPGYDRCPRLSNPTAE